jgi:hypothetical protein
LDLFEFDAYFIRGDWTVQGQLSLGQQKKASVTAAADGSLRDARWTGLSALAAYKFTPRFEGTVRGDYLRNNKNGGGLLGYTVSDARNGIGPGVSGLDANGDPVFIDADKGANRMALSMGLSYLYDQNTTFKLEYRMDRASAPVFYDVRKDSFHKNNSLLGASVLVAF